MRLVFALVAAFLIASLFMSGAAFAQTPSATTNPSASGSPSYTAPGGNNSSSAAGRAVDRASFLQGMRAALDANIPVGDIGAPAGDGPQDKPPVDVGSIDDPQSPIYKAHKLAGQAERERANAAALQAPSEDTIMGEVMPPPEIERLQNINEAQKNVATSISDDPISKEMALDMRRDAQKEAALSYGARGGLAKRNYQIMEHMRGYDDALDGVFDFRSLLIRAPSGMLIEPPIVKESIDAMVIADGGMEAAVADKIFDINKQAKIVSAPRDWRQYLIQTWTEVPPPPRVLWPRTKEEQASWSTWVSQGWEAGIEQADQIFESNVNRLVADYNGMVRYRMLLAQGMISAPYAMNEDRGITGDRNQMRVGDRAIRITGPSQFLTGAELWKPADR